jgi:CRISPR-associated protein Cas2
MTLFISYDISNDKVRTKFSKFLIKYGRRIQLSVFEIRNSQSYRHKVIGEIEKTWKPKFSMLDSVWIWEMTDNDANNRILKYGFAEKENHELVMIGF